MNTVEKLKLQLAKLKQDCIRFDKQKALSANRYMNKQDSVFDSHLFASKSLRLVDYFAEIEELVASLPAPSQRHAYNYSVNKVAEQIEAIIKVLKSSDVWAKDNNYKPRQTKPAFKQVVAKIIQSSQELYQELSQNHEFERRLQEMINERKAQLENANSEQASRLNQEILALHARLGRCRRAISATEEKIVALEKAKS
jgi:primosomal replication protein N''